MNLSRGTVFLTVEGVRALYWNAPLFSLSNDLAHQAIHNFLAFAFKRKPEVIYSSSSCWHWKMSGHQVSFNVGSEL